jgi:hypothetical protein
MDLLLSICTLVGGIAALGYFIEKYRSRKKRLSLSKRQQSEIEAETDVGGQKKVSDSHESPDILLPGQLADLIYEGKAGLWPSIIEAYKNRTNRAHLTPNERLSLIVAYDIARVRNLTHYDGHLFFFDSSWLSHDYSFWNVNSEMKRWLKELGKVAFMRAKYGRKTSRAFYWKPDEIRNFVVLQEGTTTILEHLKYGISVFLVEPKNWPNIVDLQLFTKTDAILSPDFGEISIEQLQGRSEVEPYLNRFNELETFVRTGEAVYIQLNTPPLEVTKILINQCGNLSGMITSSNHKV